jgi:hypothetical protein
MGQKPADGDKSEPSLELPSLTLPGLGRKKERRPKSHPAEGPADSPADTATDDEPTTRVPSQEPAPEPEPEPEEEPTAPLFVDEVTEQQDEDPQATPHAHIDFSLFPRVPGVVAAIITGIVVGVVGTTLTYAALRGCEAARGTQSCGKPGFFFLIAIVIVMILLGMVLLKGWQVSDAGSTSFLAVGLLCVVVLVALLEVTFSMWMFLVVPLVGAAAYAVSYWVTTRFEPPSASS